MSGYLFLSIYFVLMLFVTVYGYRKSKSSSAAYTIASKKLGLFNLVPMFFGGFISSVTLIAFTGFSYAYGFAYFSTYALGCALGWLLLQLVSGKLYSMKKNWTTTPEILGERFYSRKMRLWMAIINILYMLIYVIMGFMGGGILLSSFLNVSYYTGVVIVSAVLIFYTSIGGMYSISLANVLQSTILFFGVLLVAGRSLSLVGGWNKLISRLAEISGGPTDIAKGAMVSATANLPVTLIMGLVFGVATAVVCSTWYHRMVFSAKNKKVATSFFGFGTIFITIAYFSFFIIGVSVRALYPNLANQELAFPKILEILPGFYGGVIIVVALAALQSTLDHTILAGGSMISTDIFGLIKPGSSDNERLLVGRLGTFGIGIAAFAIAMLRPAMVITMYGIAIALIASTIFAPMFIGFYWKRATAEGGLIGSILGFIAAFLWYYFGPKNINASFIGIPVSLISVYIISLLTPPPPKEIETQFFSDV